ncbi:uncharacterized protein PAC_03997 [Phialocephala subalpina]|uniref:Leucine Rich Repeat domain protein n=1 Tax=Phialocephala subalpina TaxID=576137 RepID=A0A1L7WMV5_9HELO|nr:uncharacterized protein PAC_03997 [Phialocephala subalpina]
MKKIRAELESMKLTLSLMLMTLNFAYKITARRLSGIPSTQEINHEDEEMESVAASLLVAQQCVEDELEDLESLEEEESESETTSEEKYRSHISAFQIEESLSRKSGQRKSFRASILIADSSNLGLDLIDRASTWTNGESPGDTRELFINLLKRWANCDASESFKVQLPVRHVALQGLSPPHRAYIEAKIDWLRKDDDEAKELTLDLSRRELSTIPVEPFEYSTEISRLGLISNQLRDFTVPEKAFTKLRHLNLSYNKLERISNSITQITTLKPLHLTGNRLDNLPDSLANLQSLKTLLLRANKLSSRPYVFADLLEITLILISQNPFLKLNGYAKFEGLDTFVPTPARVWLEQGGDPRIRLTEELIQKLWEDRNMLAGRVPLP